MPLVATGVGSRKISFLRPVATARSAGSANWELCWRSDRTEIMVPRTAMLSLCFIVLSGLSVNGYADQPSAGRVTLIVQHSRAIDLFIIMDNVANWRPGWNQSQYRDSWTTRFGSMSDEDRGWIEKYARFRRRTFRDPDENLTDALDGSDGIFAKRSSLLAAADPLAVHFRASSDVQLALRNLPRSFGEKDGEMLQSFYAHFRHEWEQILVETQELDQLAEALQRQVANPAAASYTDRVQAFYGVSVQGIYPVYVVWWPSPGETAGKSRGGALYLQVNPKDASDAGGLGGIVFHEFSHFISAHMEQARKKELSQAYLSVCPIARDSNYLAFLEEPLAVTIGNTAYAESVLHKPLDFGEDWYFDPRSDLLAKLIWPKILEDWHADRPLGRETVELMGSFCSRIREAARAM
jgi:hypothetical protein